MKKLLGAVLLLCASVPLFAQITAAEYFFDKDPGYGAGTPLPPPQGDGEVQFTANIPVGNLQGLHQLYVRTRNAQGVWSLTEGRLVYINSLAQLEAGKPVAWEYFFDKDPGHGNGYAISAPQDGDQLVTEITIPWQRPGIHHLYIRALSANGIWSLVEQKLVMIFLPEASGITAAEYFFDNDPGHGAGLPVAIIPGDSLSLAVDIQIPFINPGFHQLYLRTRNAEGHWSQVERRQLYISAPLATPIVAAEGFFDTDPGHGAGIPVSIIAGDEVQLVTDITVPNLRVGFHQLYIRTRDELGRWSHTEGKLLYTTAAKKPNTIMAEYYFDLNDPGFGNGVAVQLSETETMLHHFIAVPDTMQPGLHYITLRAIDADSTWSFAETRPFIITAEPPLPVKLQYFKGNITGGQTVLQWETSIEQNASHFVVERSADGVQFYPIGTVKAKGNSSRASEYQFTDEQPLPGVNYYRLKQADLDGKSEYFGVITLQLKKAAGLRIYPNPALDFVQIVVPEPAHPATIRLTGNHGQLVKQKAVQHKNVVEVSLSGLTPGVYYIELIQGKQRFIEKLVKQ